MNTISVRKRRRSTRDRWFDLPHGGVLQYLLQRDGLDAWLGQRHRLDHLYLGRDWGAEADRVLGGTKGLRDVLSALGWARSSSAYR